MPTPPKTSMTMPGLGAGWLCPAPGARRGGARRGRRRMRSDVARIGLAIVVAIGMGILAFVMGAKD